MVSLFNGVNNHLFIKLCEVINAVQNGEALTKKQLLTRLMADDFNYEYATDTKTEETLADYFFTFDSENGTAECRLLDEVTFFLTNDEKAWIASLLKDEQFAFLLTPSLREKMEGIFLSDKEAGFGSYWYRMQRNAGKPMLQDKQECIKNIFSAFRNQKNILCSYTDGTGKNSFTVTGSPCRLEYDLALNTYNLLLWTGNAPVKIPLECLATTALLPIERPTNIEEKFQAYLEKCSAKVRLEVQEKNNAVERCFAMFSSYDKDSWRSDDGKYILEVNYYDFDYPEIRRNILSLGSAVTVLQPESIATDILDELKNMLQRYTQ